MIDQDERQCQTMRIKHIFLASWLTDRFIPEFQQTRRLFKYADDSFLIMDERTARMSNGRKNRLSTSENSFN
jgi:hypothetical protein